MRLRFLGSPAPSFFGRGIPAAHVGYSSALPGSLTRFVRIQSQFVARYIQCRVTPRQGQLGTVTTSSRPQKYFAEAAYLWLARKPVVSGPGEIAGSERCGEGCGVMWGLNRSVLGSDWLRSGMPGVGVLEEDYKTNRKQNGYTRMLRFANILISKPYTVRLYCDSGYSDKRMTRLVSALRGEARADAGHTEDQSPSRLPDKSSRWSIVIEDVSTRLVHMTSSESLNERVLTDVHDIQL